MTKTHMQKYVAVAAAVVLVIVILLAGRGGSKPGASGGPLVDKVEAYRVQQNGKPTSAAHASIAFTRKSGDYAFANLAIDLNKDGSYAAYDLADKAKQQEWVVQNMPVKVMTEGNDFSFDLLDRSVDDGKDFKAVVVLSKKPLSDWKGDVPADTSSAAVTISAFEPDDFGTLISPSPEGTGGAPSEKPVHGGPLDQAKVKTPNAQKYLKDTTAAPSQGSGEGQAPVPGAVPAGGPPAAGTDFSVLQTDVPDMSQGVNECVPTSTSNALTWLGNRYGFKDRLPKDQRSIIEELKPDFSWTAANGVLVEDNYLGGKSDFVARHNLPIYTYQVGSKFDDDVATKVAAELAKGQAVEIVIGYYEWNAHTNKWERHGGHMLSAVGAFGANGKTYLGLHDPASPGPNRLDVYENIKSRMYNYRYRGNYAVFIEYAIAESPTEAWVKDHPATSVIETTGGIVEARDAQDTWFVDALKIGNAWYPTAQFHTFVGPECDKAEHWHANFGTALGFDLKGKPDFDYNPSNVQSRHADIVEWKDPESCGAGKVAQVERKNILISKEEAERMAAKAMAR